MPQIIPVVSEALQNTVRRLLPSQNGFGEDLQAQNVIVPIIDLTASAEGSSLDVSLQQAINYGGNTAFQVTGTTTSLAATAGFWRVSGTISLNRDGSTVQTGFLAISDGLSSKNVYGQSMRAGGGEVSDISTAFDLIIFLDSGETLNATSTARTYITGSYRQIASSTGELVNPVGFTVE
jgi:hypothetical protein